MTSLFVCAFVFSRFALLGLSTIVSGSGALLVIVTVNCRAGSVSVCVCVEGGGSSARFKKNVGLSFWSVSYGVVILLKAYGQVRHTRRQKQTK